ncbi:hypothetical protein Spith_0140 [Spirochaeta thermophila DSM 6578]|uniref:Ig-like domain-containing protein n=1 Tax=Winmispira thermophila (strain ATCC 700085 / DSM 6578 / Z-1203) TaxID=869211 RepID=G0GC63_WINT7|nr:Ig-like domain-containing protein [Spirochaeta thermophila]AEJ60427.1 hypothetical protein Spith_0140 [Spirochaeta thermophila DSM 6578]
MKHITKLTGYVVAVITLFIVVLGGCDVGLGEQVDVARPRVALTSHESGEYVKGVVTLSGTAEDDTGIEEVQISFDRGATFKKVSNLVSKDGKIEWSYAWDTTKITDGRYYVVIKAFDSGGHQYQTEEIVFTVDNHPPVLLVSSPSKVADPTQNPHNQQAILSVHAADYSPLVSFTVDVWASDNPEDDPSTWEHLSGFPHTEAHTASPWNYTFQSTPYTLDIGKPQRSFHFVVSAEDKAGNISQTFYHTDDIYQLGGITLTVEQVRQILEGSPPEGISVTPQDLGAVALSADAPFTLYFDEEEDNPKITFLEGGTKFFTSEDITIEVEDDDAVDKDSLVFTLSKSTDGGLTYSLEPGFPLTGWTNIVADSHISVKKNETRLVQFAFACTDLEAGNFYKIEVESKDPYGNDTSEFKEFEVITSDNEPPQITGVQIDGTSLPSGGFHVSSGSYTLSFTVSDNEEVSTVEVLENGTSIFQQAVNKISESFSVPVSGNPDGSYTYEIIARDVGDLSTNVVRQVIVDSVAPQIEFSIVPPVTSPAPAFNGVVNLSGLISDDNPVDLLYYYIGPDDTDPAGSVTVQRDANGRAIGVSGLPAGWQSYGGPSNNAWTLEYDTTVLSDGTYYIGLLAADRNGNLASSFYTMVVDQSSDVPVVTVSSPSDGGFAGAGHVVSGTVADDDGVDTTSIELRYSTDGGSTWSGWTPVSVTGTGKNVSFTYTLPDLGADGLKQIEMRASDDPSKKLGSAPAAITTTEGPVSFTYDATGPDVDITTPAMNEAFVSSFTATGTVLEENLQTLRLKIDTGSWQTLTPSGTAPNYSWTYDVDTTLFDSLSQGPHSLTVEAVDKVGQTDAVQVTFYKDSAGPGIVFTSIQEGVNTILTSTSPVVAGSISDDYSNIASQIEYRIDGADPDPWQQAGVSGSGKTVSFSIDVSSLSDGQHDLDIRATDALGNQTEIVDVQFRIDRAAPSLSITGPAEGTVYGTVPSGVVFTLTGTASDALLDTVTADLEGTPLSNGGSATTWSFDVDKTVFDALTEGAHTIQVTAMDLAGRSTLISWQFIKDGQPPVISFSNINEDGSTVLQDASPVINGVVSDMYGVGTVETRIEQYNYSTSSWEPVEDWMGVGNPAGATVYVWSKDLGPSGLNLGAGRYRISVRATDTAQNTPNQGEKLHIEFAIDQQAPDLTIDPIAMYQNGDFTLTGTASDDGAIASVKIKVDDTDFSTGAVDATYDSGTGTWSVSVPTGGLLSGDHTVYVQAKDSAGKTVMLNKPFVFDNEDPGVSILEPTHQTRVNGEVTIRGTTSDNVAVATVEYRFGKNATTWQTSGLSGLYSWSYTFTQIESYANDTYATEIDPATGLPQAGTNVWALPFQVRVTDVAGNVYEELSYELWIDPDMDTPLVYITSHTNNQTVGGTVRLAGYATDDDWVYDVEYRVDPTGTGSGYGSWASANRIGAGTQVNWYVNLNEDGSLNPPPGEINEVLVQVRAVDSKDNGLSRGIEGDVASIRLRFDSNVPVIEDVEVFKADGTKVPYTAGERVAGTFTVEAVMRDEGGLSEIEWRGEGTTLFTDVLSDPTVVTTPPEVGASEIRAGVKYLITSVGTTDFTAIGASSNDVGITFTATGPGTGTGTAYMAVTPPLVPAAELVSGEAYAIFDPGTTDWTAVGAPDNSVGTPFVATGAGTGDGIAFRIVAATELVADEAYRIYEPGTTDWTAVGAPDNNAGTTFTATGAGTGDGFAIEPEKLSFVYRFHLQLDSTTLNGGAYAATSGFYQLDLRVTDNASPTPYMSQQSLNLQIDNYYPSGEYLASPNAATAEYYIQGRGWDSGTGSGPIQGIGEVVVYFEREGSFIDLAGGAGSWTTRYVKDEAAGGTYQDVTFPADTASGIWVDTNEIGVDIDGDGYVEGFSTDGIYKNWYAIYDTTVLADGPVTLHYVIIDAAGNATHYTQDLYIQNNIPQIDNVVIGTDLDNSSTIDPGETKLYNTNYETTNFTVRNHYLQFQINASSGNGQLYYRVGYVTGTTSVPASSLVRGGVYTIETVGDTDWTRIGALANQAGITFVATGPGTGSGTAISYTTTELNATLTSNVVDLTDFSSIPDSAVANDRRFIIKVYDSTVPAGGEEEQLAAAVLVGLTVDNTDEAVPELAVADMGQTYSVAEAYVDRVLQPVSSYEDNIVTSGDGTRQGYVQYAAASSDADADVSGKVIFFGKAYDNQNLQRIQVQITGYDGGTGIGQPFEIAVASGGTLVSANSATIADVEAGNADWAFEVVSGSESLTVDNGHVINWKFAWNTATVQNVAQDNVTLTFTVEDTSGNTGTPVSYTVDVRPYITDVQRDPANFNTYRSKYGWYSLRRGETVQITGFNLYSSPSDTISFGGAAVNLPSSATTTSFSLTVPATAVSGAITLMVNGLEALNNINDNTETYNQEYDTAEPRSTLWTDDRYAHIWQSNDTTGTLDAGYFPGSDNPVHPAMTVDPSTGRLYASWSHYATSQVYRAAIDDAGRTTVFRIYDPSEHTDIDYGVRPVIAYNANYYNGATTYGGLYVWDPQAPYQFSSAGVDNYFYQGENMGHDQYLMQFINERVVTVGDNIHVSYYDTETKALKYMYIQSGDTSTAEHSWVNLDGGSDGDDIQVVSTGRVSAAGEFSAIDVTPLGYPVIAYYDISRQTVRIARATSTTPTTAADWVLQDVISTSDPNYRYSGKYISMRIDSQGYVHLAFFRVSTGDLIYMKSTNNPQDGSTDYTFGPTVVVDNEGSVGIWADISLTDDDRPVITYLDFSLVNTFDGLKMAFYDPALEREDGDVAGEPDTSDGWETMYAALGYDIDNKRLSIEYDTGGHNGWWAAIGYASSDYYRVAYYVK